jgi:uncharacterized protein YycO
LPVKSSIDMRILKRACLLVSLALAAGSGLAVKSPSYSANSSSQSRTRTINSWLDFKFDASAPTGSAKNPAVMLPREFAAIVADMNGVQRLGEVFLISAADLQKAANQPLAGVLLAPMLGQVANVKSFDGFSAIDMTGIIKGLPSELTEGVDATGKVVTGEKPEANGKLLRNGDLVFGSHVVNYMTWGRYNHVAIVTDVARGILVEATASLGTDKPGVRTTDWKTFASAFVHVGIVRLKNASPDQLSRVIRWVDDRKGKPYRWPIIQGLDKTDQSRFYCSQLVWLAYKEVLGIDLDVDQGVLVFPDDIYYAKNYVDIIVP